MHVPHDAEPGPGAQHYPRLRLADVNDGMRRAAVRERGGALIDRERLRPDRLDLHRRAKSVEERGNVRLPRGDGNEFLPRVAPLSHLPDRDDFDAERLGAVERVGLPRCRSASPGAADASRNVR